MPTGLNNAGVLGGPNLSDGFGIPPPGGGGITPVDVGTFAPADAAYELASLDSRLPNGVVFNGIAIRTTNGLPPADTSRMWIDGQALPEILYWYSPGAASWVVVTTATSGFIFRHGAGAPSAGLGSNGDLYLDTVSGDLYQKAAGAWGSPLINLKGPKGDTGDAGTPGADGAAIDIRGTWSPMVTYDVRDMVTYLGVAYVALQTSTDVIPTSDPTTWMAMGVTAYVPITTDVRGELPSGTINGSNVTFTLANAPAVGIALYQNGTRLRAGAGNDYTLSGLTITMASAPPTGAVLQADYEYGGIAHPINNEAPAGAIDGANVTFALAQLPIGGISLYQTGVGRLLNGGGNDYTVSGQTITMASAPSAGDALLADYAWLSQTPVPVRGEALTGALNGVNLVFTLAFSPLFGIDLYQSGTRLAPTADYTIVGQTVTMVNAPLGADWLAADYQHA